MGGGVEVAQNLTRCATERGGFWGKVNSSRGLKSVGSERKFCVRVYMDVYVSHARGLT